VEVSARLVTRFEWLADRVDGVVRRMGGGASFERSVEAFVG
jgi:hypothetical protein